MQQITIDKIALSSIFMYPMIKIQTATALCAKNSPADRWVIVMGVAGCGKSTLAQSLATALKLTFIEGDRFHPPENIQKMSQGIALNDTDREGWLDRLGVELTSYPDGAVLACSALKRTYRNRLRKAVPNLNFVHLCVTQDVANARVQARSAQHLFPSSLVASQFATLEDPLGEDRVLQLDGSLDASTLCVSACEWIAAQRIYSPAN